jgi:hypothetical protein
MQVVDIETGLFRIPLSSIKPAKEFDEFEFGFFNPRILDVKNRENYGFSSEEKIILLGCWEIISSFWLGFNLSSCIIFSAWFDCISQSRQVGS